MREVTATFARANWAQILDEARTEPIAVTSHGRARVVIASAAVSDAIAEAYARIPGSAVPVLTRDEIRAAAEATVLAPHHPWMDLSLPFTERRRLIRERKKALYADFGNWTAEEEAILRFDSMTLPLSDDERDEE
ncbi:MAG: type II toxin-antitoxin system prevent-host-death family antitoxin [Microbacteriaceae bacterium]|nr:type II toxin-antitoxin system prevent-host-death family antitoxin [Microbacteriaceae bacterium]MCL2793785.1 type II toxin-antitoxin system prevent-host-death family antitoxin [Microbacteriaceae bacterium]